MSYTPSSANAIDNEYNLIVCDEDIKEQADKFKKLGEQLQSTLDSYIAYLEKLKGYAILEGLTAEALATYIDYSKKLDNVFGNMGSTYSTYLEQFLSDVDDYDEELY